MLNRLEFSRDPQALFAHVGECWREACAGQSLPRRQDISPAKLARALPYVSLLDVIPGPPMDFQYRLMGQHLIVNLGVNATGMRVLSLPQAAPTGRPIYQAMLKCVEMRASSELLLDVLNTNGTKHKLSMAVWPLGEPNEAPNCVLGVGHFQE